MARVMSDAEVRRRKKLQGHISQTTGALGLTALGGTLLATKRGGKLTSAAFKGAGKTRPKALEPGKLKGHTAPILATSAGIGGLGAFNFAAYTGAESRKRKQAMPVTVKKEYGMDMGHYGEEGRPVELEEIRVPIEKAWSPTANNFDSEANRHKRRKVAESGALAGAGAGAAYSGRHAVKGVKEARKLRPQDMAPVTEKVVNAQGDKRPVPFWKEPGRLLTEKAVPTKALKPALKHGGRAAAGAGAVGAALGTHAALRRKKRGSWESYGKRDTVSAFGVDHDLDWVGSTP